MLALAGLLAASFSLGFAAPAQPDTLTYPLLVDRSVKTDGTSSLQFVSKSAKSANSGPMILVADVLAGKQIAHTDDSTGVAKSATGLVSQEGNDISYFINLQIGSPSQNFSVIVDTGSYYTWVYGTNCTLDVCTSHSRYDPTKASSAQALDVPFSIQYTGSNVNGTVFNDVVSFAGFETRVDFGVAEQAGNTFASFPIDGIFGLSANDFSPSTFPGVLTTLQNQTLISNRVFSVNLGRASDPQDQGSITFGGTDSSKFSGDILYTDLESDQILWTLPVDNTSVNGNIIDFGNRSAIIDTGTTLLVMPPADALKLHGTIPGSETDGTNFAIPCDSQVTVEIAFNGHNWPIGSSDFIGGQLENNQSMCATNVQGLSLQNTNTWILGDTFLKTVYAVFDMDNQRIGFANKTATATNDTPSNSLVLASLNSDVSSAESAEPTSTSSSSSSTSSVASSSPAPPQPVTAVPAPVAENSTSVAAPSSSSFVNSSSTSASASSSSTSSSTSQSATSTSPTAQKTTSAPSNNAAVSVGLPSWTLPALIGASLFYLL